MGFATVTAKLANMRKAQEFIVMPMSDGKIMVQSDKSIGAFDFRTGKGKLNTKGKYFIHLNMGAVAFTFPAEFVSECLRVCPSMGGETELGHGITMVNTVQVI